MFRHRGVVQMKLEDKTYNEKYPKFVVKKPNARLEGVPLGESITLKLVDDYFEWQGTRMSGPLLSKNIPYEGKTFSVHEMTATVVEPEIENMKYSAYNTATFGVPEAVAKDIGKDYDLEAIGGKTFKLTLIEKTGNAYKKDKDGNIELDSEGNKQLVEMTWMTFQTEEVLADGTTKVVGEGKGPKQESLQNGEGVSPEVKKVNASVSAEMEDEAREILDKAIKEGIKASNMSFDDFFDWVSNDDDESVAKLRDSLTDYSDEDGTRVIKVWYSYIF